MASSITRFLTAELRVMRALALDHRGMAEAVEKKLVKECTKCGINSSTHAPRPRREAALDLNLEGLADSGDSGDEDGEAGPAPKRARAQGRRIQRARRAGQDRRPSPSARIRPSVRDGQASARVKGATTSQVQEGQASEEGEEGHCGGGRGRGRGGAGRRGGGEQR